MHEPFKNTFSAMEHHWERRGREGQREREREKIISENHHLLLKCSHYSCFVVKVTRSRLRILNLNTCVV